MVDGLWGFLLNCLVLCSLCRTHVEDSQRIRREPRKFSTACGVFGCSFRKTDRFFLSARPSGRAISSLMRSKIASLRAGGRPCGLLSASRASPLTHRSGNVPVHAKWTARPTDCPSLCEEARGADAARPQGQKFSTTFAPKWEAGQLFANRNQRIDGGGRLQSAENGGVACIHSAGERAEGG